MVEQKPISRSPPTALATRLKGASVLYSAQIDSLPERIGGEVNFYYFCIDTFFSKNILNSPQKVETTEDVYLITRHNWCKPIGTDTF